MLHLQRGKAEHEAPAERERHPGAETDLEGHAVLREDRDRVRPERHERRVAERDLSGVPEGEVQPDGQDLVRPCDGGADPLVSQLRHLACGRPGLHDAADAIDAPAGEERLVEVGDHVGEVDVVLAVDARSGLLSAGRSGAHEVHRGSPGSAGVEGVRGSAK